jgi:AraC family transcriptional regulator
MLRYIDSNIKEKLNVEKLAARAGFSPYHFCRVFQWNIGFSIMEYVRIRRLAFAASELNSGKRITDIAFEYGFETHTGFTKAFKRFYGYTPEIYRMHASFDEPKLPILKETKQYICGGIIMEPKMVKKTAIKLAGFVIKTTTKDGENFRIIPKFWQEYMTDGRCEKIHKETFFTNHAEYGACFMTDPENGLLDYVIGLETKDGMDIPKNYYVCTIPEALYAVFSSPPVDRSNFPAEIQGTWKYIYNEWFPKSGYEFDENGVDFEYYDERAMAETGCVCDIYIPVIKKPV